MVGVPLVKYVAEVEGLVDDSRAVRFQVDLLIIDGYRNALCFS